MDTHLPYLPPASYRKQRNGAPVRDARVYELWQALVEDPASLSDEDVDALWALYLAEATYVDDQIQRLI